MSEIITIQVGQCGNQIGSSFWPLALEEHGISTGNKLQKPICSDALHSFFHCPSAVPESGFSSISDLKQADVRARCLLIDMEESVVSRFGKGSLRDLFNKNCFLTDRPGSGNNWAVGHYEHGAEQKENIMDMLHREAERTDSLHGFLMLFSLGGGTGSGLGSNILTYLEDNFSNVDRLVACVHPGSHNDVITSPYNTAFTLRKLTDHATCVFPVDNMALFDIANRRKSATTGRSHSYHDVNSLIVNMLLNVTSGSRFPGPLNVDLNELATNMTPFKGLHYLTSSFSPTYPDSPSSTALKNSDLMSSVCSKSSQLMRVDPFSGTMLSATLLCRGALALSDSRNLVDRFCKKAKLVSWNKTGVKTGICTVPLAGTTRSMLCLTNSTSMTNLFSETVTHFNKLYKRKAHVHHYLKVNGFEEDEFHLATSSMMDTIERYKQACQKIDIPRIEYFPDDIT